MNIPLKSRIARYFFSLLPCAGLIPPPSRPQGISAILRVLDEKNWLEASIDSLKDHVEEIIAVDTGSTDGSLEILERLSGKVKNLKVFRFPGGTPWEFNNFAIEKTSYRWIMKWDADCVAFSGAAGPLGGITEYVRSLNLRMYYYINPGLIELTGDFYHQFPDMRVRGDMELFTYSEGARYVPIERTFDRSPYPLKLPAGYSPEPFSIRMDGIRLPRYYRILAFGEAVAYHINIKPAVRQLLGYFFLQWLASEGFSKKQTLADYALEQVKTKWGYGDLQSAADFYMTEYTKLLVRYDESLGALPGNIKALAAGSPFKIIYEAGRPARRLE